MGREDDHKRLVGKDLEGYVFDDIGTLSIPPQRFRQMLINLVRLPINQRTFERGVSQILPV
jgi:hypothetical protein